MRPAHIKERKPPRYPSPEALQLIYDLVLSGEVERIWNAIKALGPLSRNSIEAHKEAALECFDKHRGKRWKWITRRALESPAPWKQWRGGKEKGDFRGRLLQELIAEQFLKEQQKQADKWRRKGELEQSLRCEQQAPVGYAWELLEKIAKELETAEK